MKNKKFRGGWRSKLRRFLPSTETVRNNKWVGWIGPALYHPRLWQLNRKGVATGVAIGIFFGFLVPLLQIPFAAIFAVWFRGHLVAAVVSTMITNPLTFAPIYLLANEIGSFICSNKPKRSSSYFILFSANGLLRISKANFKLSKAEREAYIPGE